MASNIHVKIGDIKGESTDAKHKNEIDIESWGWGASNPGVAAAGGGAGAGRASFSDLTFVHRFDSASPPLWRACATGARIRDATLTEAKAGKSQADFLIVKMSDVQITGVHASDHASDGGSGIVPFEQVSMKFAKVQIEYRPQKPDGSFDTSVVFKYDIKANKEF